MSVADVLADQVGGRATGVPQWLPTDSGALYGVVHTPPAEIDVKNTSVLVLPTFGWAETCAYRGRRAWATELARAGFLTLRIDLPGTGESYGGAREPDLVNAWLGSIEASVGWLRATGSERVAVIGVGLGGLLAVKAIADGTAIDDLILWGVPARGRALVRELRVHAGVVDQTFLEDIEGHEPENGDIALTGYLMTAETVATLETIRLDELRLAPGTLGRALLIERDRLPVDSKLQARLNASGAAVTVQSASDFHLLMEHPGRSATPARTIARSIGWLETGAGPRLDRPRLTAGAPVTWFEADGQTVSESLIGWGTRAGRLVGVLTEPVAGPRRPFCVVMLNAGALRKTGPTRMWVELSRHWAARGVPVARIDVEGVGDSDGKPDEVLDIPNLHTEYRNAQTRQVLDHLQEAGVADSFVFVGLCSGAYWGARTALQDERVVALLLLNLWAFEWHPEQVVDVLREAAANVIRTGLVRRVLREGVSREDRRMALEAFRGLRSRGMARRAANQLAEQDRQETEDALGRLKQSNTRVLLLLSRGERFLVRLSTLGFMARLTEWPNLSVEELPTRDHDLRAPWVQELITRRLDAALEELTSLQS